MNKIYLDANATSSVRPSVVEVYKAVASCSSLYANPSSVHEPGRKARAELRAARDVILDFAGVSRDEAELVFTSGGTESCNLMISGVLGSEEELVKYPQHIICSTIEHLAVIEAVRNLEKLGWQVSWVDPEPNGVVSVSAMTSCVRQNTSLVILMGANNETGILQPILELSNQLRISNYSGLIASDLVQCFGKSKISISSLFKAGVDVLAISGHKIGALPGIGAILINKSAKRCLQFYPRSFGGPQEKGFRGGTENLYGAIGFAAAVTEVRANFEDELVRISSLREALWCKIKEDTCDLAIRITPKNDYLEGVESSICNTLTLRFLGCRADDLVVALDIKGIFASTGSACSSGRQATSHVIKAMGLDSKEGREVIRFSLDWNASLEEVRIAAEVISQTVREVSNV